MDTTFIAMGSALLEGIGLILSPCILPILPIVLASSVDGGRRRPLGIITGFILAFTLFALLSRQILGALHVDPEILRNAALILLILFGAIMLSQKLSNRLLSATEGLANAGQTLASRWDKKQGYLGGVGVGALIGLIWTPCAGPIMAAAIVQIIQAKSSSQVVLTVIMFALGAGIPMLLIALLGRRLLGQMSFFKKHSTAVRRVLGVIIIVTAFLIYKGFDIQLIAGAGSDSAPAPTNVASSTTPSSTAIPATAMTASPTAPPAATAVPSNAGAANFKILKAVPLPYAAPDISGAAGPWLNTSGPLTPEALKGHVVLVDFWTYSCINCVRTLPYLTKWDQEYRDKGLIILGVHAPEFEFEKNTDNVRAALEKYGIHYPVVQDNDLQIWDTFQNKYWPAHYLIDQNGQVVYTHFGEGDYDVTEHNILALLHMAPPAATSNAKPASGQQPSDETPETYLGYGRANSLTTKTPLEKDVMTDYQLAYFVPIHHWTLGGKWVVEQQKIVATEGKTVLELNFKAKKVFMVMGTTTGKPLKVTFTFNDESLGYRSGKDIKDDSVTVDHQGLYEIVSQPNFENDLLQVNAPPGLEIYTFTFGD